MTLPPFDGSEYRRTVLTPLRTSSAAAAEDLFWLGHVPRDLDEGAAIAARLKETKAFLHKERARPRQADVAAAVLREWSRVEGVLGDGAARRSLRLRLGDAAPGGTTGAPGTGGAPSARPATGDPASRRRHQVSAGLAELARLRGEPELAEDLFAFLGLPLTATSAIVATRLAQIGDANRRRRPDRERSLTDELLIHARELLVDGDPAVYRAWITGAEPESAPANADVAEREPGGPASPEPVLEAAKPEPAVPPAAAARPAISFDRARARRPEPELEAQPQPQLQPEPGPALQPSAPLVPGAPPVENVLARRDPDGDLLVQWAWPEGVTEAFVSVGERSSPADPGDGGRKVTNTKYEIDGGARLVGVEPGATVRVHSGRRDGAGQLVWNLPVFARETIAP